MFLPCVSGSINARVNANVRCEYTLIYGSSEMTAILKCFICRQSQIKVVFDLSKQRTSYLLKRELILFTMEQKGLGGRGNSKRPK